MSVNSRDFRRMYRSVTKPVASWRATRADYVLVALALIAYLSAGWIARLQQTDGPPAQRVHIRWAADLSSDDRLRAEQELGLFQSEHLDGRTWRYFLGKRSRQDIARLLSDRRIEDTFHIDREALRIQIDRPDLSPRARALLESDRLDEISIFLIFASIVFAWCARRLLIAVVYVSASTIAKVFDRRRERTYPTWLELAIGVAMGILFLIPLLPYGPYELEDVQNTILPNQVFYSELFHGRWMYWLNNLGFGAPMPLGVPLMFHPVFAPLVAFTSLRVTLTAVWLAQMAVMVVYFLRLLAATDIWLPGLRLLLTAFLVASAPSIFYFYQTDWIEYVIAWTLYPVLVLYLRAAILGEARERFWLTALRLGLLFGFWVINGHPGFIITSVLAMTVYVVVAAPPERRVYLCLGTAAALCVAIASSRIYTFVRELRLFPVTSEDRGGVDMTSYIGAFVWPLAPNGGRAPFIGFGIGAAAIAALGSFARVMDAHLRGCVAAFFVSAVFNVIPSTTWSWILPGVSPFSFRDPMVFFGLLAGGHVLQRAFRARQRAYRYAAAILLLLQVIQQWFLLAAPTLDEPRQRADKLQFYRHQGHAFGLGRVLVDNAQRFGPRIYLSRDVDRVMQGNLSSDGIHLSSDLVLLGLNPVNGWFKNVSLAVMQPPMSLMESFISGSSNVISNPALLDVLGINLVLTTEHETGVPPGLMVVDRPRVHDERLADLVLLANADAWPQAVLLRRDAYTVQLPVHAGCQHTGALCRDYETLSQMRLAGEVTLQASNGRYMARITPSDEERLLFISAMYRPEWTATAATGPLTVHPVANAFLGVTVPPGVTDITVAFTPRIQIALTWFSNLVFAGAAVALLVIRRRSSQKLQATGTVAGAAIRGSSATI
jgi:hypothetical protein